MAIPKKLSKELIEINKNKQRLLNSAGYNVKVDGSWGPWQELLYNKIMSRGRMFTDKRAVLQAAQAKWENDHNKSIAGYYFSDTPTLPNLAKGTYHWLMGNIFGDSENPEYYRMNVGDAPSNIVGPAGATKLPTTAKEFVLAVKNFRVPTLRTLFGLPTKNINVGRLSSTTRSLVPVITTVAGSSNLVPIRVVEPAVSLTAPAQAALAAQATAPATNTSAADSGKGFWGNLLRVLWETKDNNFGKYYIGKNILRAAGYPFIIPPLLGTLYEHVPEAFRSYGDYAKKSFNYGRGRSTVQDSTRVDSTSRDSSLIALPTNSLQVQLSQHVIPQARNGVIQAEDMSAVIDSILGI